MLRLVLVGLAGGVAFMIMDVLINANPLAQRLMGAYRPIMRTKVKAAAGTAIDVIYGLAMAGIYVMIVDGLPGDTGIVRGMCYGGMMWFFRAVMFAATHYVMFAVPTATLLYGVAAGLVEMLALGVLFGLSLPPGLLG